MDREYVTELQLHKVLHMNEGDDDKSYANNSFFQKKVMLKAKPIVQESIMELYMKHLPECITVADMGSSSGPNTFLPIWEIIEAIDEACCQLNKKTPILQVFVNDLPGNDFNSIFRQLPSFHNKLVKEKGGKFEHCFVYAVPGSFYGRLFPPQSILFVHSSYSLQWFSEVPKILGNKGNIYLAKTSPPSVHKAYLDQFERDFKVFLRCRSEEIMPGGRMVVTIYGTDDQNLDLTDKYSPDSWELLGMMLNDMTSEGLIEESKLDSFNLPFYGPSAQEVKDVIEAQGQFKINKFESFNVGWDASINDCYKDTVLDKYTRGKYVSNHMRAISESLLATHFGIGSEVIDVIFQRFSTIIGDYMETDNGAYYTSHVFSMTKE